MNFKSGFAKGTEVLLLDGTFKKVEDIKVGDLLLGPDSKVRKVTNLYRGKNIMCDVLNDDGLLFRADYNHNLYLRINTKITEMTIQEYYVNIWCKHKPELRKCCVEFKSVDTPISPYSFGRALLTGEVPESGSQSKVIRNYITNNGLDTYKMIPKIFKYNSIQYRLLLLAGFIDSENGHYDKDTNSYFIEGDNPTILNDIAYVARSLKLNASIKEGRVYIKGDLSILTNSIHDERKHYSPISIPLENFRVEVGGEEDFYGFEVEGDGKFLLSSFYIASCRGNKN